MINRLKKLQRLNLLQQELLCDGGGLYEDIKKITDGVVEIFNADFCRIWIKGPGDKCDKGCIHANAKDPEKLCRKREYCLHLIASSGRYTHIDGPHSRMPFGLYKVGRIADGQVNKFLTNDVVNDPQITDHEWARGIGLVSFVGYKLQDTNGEPIGVLALFSKQSITPEEDAMLEGIAGITTHVIHTAKVKEALKMERDKLMNIMGSMGDGVYIVNKTHDIEYVNPIVEREFGPMKGRKCHEYFHNMGEVCPWCKNQEVFAGKTVRWECYFAKNNKIYDMLGTPLYNYDGSISALEIFRDITERKQAEEEIRLLQSMTQSISEAEDFYSALKIVLQKVCEATDWVFGEAWIPTYDGVQLKCSPAWYSSSEGLKKFRTDSEKFTFPPGVGLPGRVWKSKTPAWVEDVTKDPNFPRAAIAMEAGIRAGVAIPIMADKEVVAVMDFFMFEPKTEDKLFVNLISSIAAQIGLVIKRKEAERHLNIQYSVVSVLAESATLKEAAPKIIEAICESTGWDMGAIWIIDHETDVLRCIEQWRRPSVDFSEFEVVTGQFIFSKGVGMPGRVWDTGRPAWIIDVTQDTNFPRAPYAAKVGIHSSFGFPIRLGGEVFGVLGVIEFFSRKIRYVDEELLYMFGAIGSQIGQFIERKRAEQELALFRALVDRSNDAIEVVDPETGRFLDMNERGLLDLGYSREELPYLRVWDIDPAVDQSSFPKIIEGLRKSGSIIWNSHHQRKDGSKFPVEINIKYIKLDRDYVITVVRDVTERKRAQADLENSLSLLHATLESTADGILAVNSEGKITTFNKKFTDMWRIPESVVASRDDNQALAFVLEQLKDPEGFLAKVRELYSQPDAESDDVLEFKDGRVFERYSRPQFIGGKNVGRVWSFRDVTERRKIEKELVSKSILTTELIKLNKMKSQFLANVSHELRTPLNSILGFSELLIEKSFGELNEKQTQYVNYINQSGCHLLRLINNILDMSKVESGRVELEPEEFPLTDAIDDVLNIIGPMAHKKSVIIVSKPIPLSIKVVLDRAKFKQIMLNLISNAVKFNKKGGNVDIDWDISEEAKGDILERFLRISVKDTGIGIKNQDIPRLFRDFEQLDSSVTREYGGTGIGMALTKKLIELHGGRIWVESEYGKGTKFSFVIPQSASGPRHT